MDEVLGLIELARGSREVDEATEEWIEEQIRLRKEAREDRDFGAADAIGTLWRRRASCWRTPPKGPAGRW